MLGAVEGERIQRDKKGRHPKGKLGSSKEEGERIQRNSMGKNKEDPGSERFQVCSRSQ